MLKKSVTGTAAPRKSHVNKTWRFCFSLAGLRKLIAQDRRIRRKAVSAGLRLRRLKSAPWGIQLVDQAGHIVRHSLHDRDIEGFLDHERALRMRVAAR